MIALLLVTEAERTTRTFTTLIVALVVVAVLIGLLTIWYWRHTSPKRRYRRRLETAPPARQEPEPDVHDRYDRYSDGGYRDDHAYQDHGDQSGKDPFFRADANYPEIYSRVPGGPDGNRDDGVVRPYQQVTPGTFARQARGEGVEPRPTGELAQERIADRRRSSRSEPDEW
ncbi:MAG: hypothetical protein ACK5PP_10695 [Acidimicrobiales bacterium]